MMNNMMNMNTATRTINNAPDGRGLFRGISGNFTRFSQIVEEFIDNAVADFLAHADTMDVPCVDIILEENDGYVDVAVRDGGSGITDLDAALTIGGPVQDRSPLHEHSMGMKHALASVCASEEQNWSIQTRTAEDAAANRYREVKSPYGIGTMTCEVKEGCGDIIDKTGTVVRFRCPMSMFETLKPKNKRVEPTFEEYIGYLVEELRYTYAPLLERGELCFIITAVSKDYNDSFVVEAPLKPDWVDGENRKVPPVKTDFGGGEVTLHIHYGTIVPSKGNAIYYKGNMASSGFEIRLNGRLIERGLYEEVYGEKLHPSQNLFIAQIDIEYDAVEKVPPTKTAKNGFRQGTPKLEALYRAIRMYVEKPKKDCEKLETKFVKKLKEKMETDPEVVRATMEEGTYETLGLGTTIDLFVSRTDGAVFYEAKVGSSKADDLYQVMMYWDGCERDGKPVQEAVLIAARHPKEVQALSEVLRRRTDTAGSRYNIRLATWAEEGITLSRQAA